MKAKLLVFLVDPGLWVYLGVLVLIGAIASRVSITLAVVLVVACAEQEWLLNTFKSSPSAS